MWNNWYWKWLESSNIDERIKNAEQKLSKDFQDDFLNTYKTKYEILSNNVKKPILDILFSNPSLEKNKEKTNNLFKTVEDLFNYTLLLKEKNTYLQASNDNLNKNFEEERQAEKMKIENLERSNISKSSKITELEDNVVKLEKDILPLKQEIGAYKNNSKIDENEINRLSQTVGQYLNIIKQKDEEISKIFLSKYPSDVDKNYNLYELLEALEKSKNQELIIEKLREENFILDSKLKQVISEFSKYEEDKDKNIDTLKKYKKILFDRNSNLKKELAIKSDENNLLKTQLESYQETKSYIWTDAEWLVKLVEQFYQDK